MKRSDFRKGYELCMENTAYLMRDGDFLADNGSFSHAFFLYFTAMEEAAKAYFYAGIHANLFTHDALRSFLIDHQSKTAFFFWFLVGQHMLEGKMELPSEVSRDYLVEALKGFYEALVEGKRLRETCLYVDMKGNA